MVNIYEANQKVPYVQLGINLSLLIVFIFLQNSYLFFTTLLLNILLSVTFVIIKKYGMYFELIINSKKLKISKVMNILDKTLKKY